MVTTIEEKTAPENWKKLQDSYIKTHKSDPKAEAESRMFAHIYETHDHEEPIGSEDAGCPICYDLMVVGFLPDIEPEDQDG